MKEEAWEMKNWMVVSGTRIDDDFLPPSKILCRSKEILEEVVSTMKDPVISKYQNHSGESHDL